MAFLSLLPIGCSSSPAPSLSSPLVHSIPREDPAKSWIIAPPLKGDEEGDWYFLRARVTSHDILFYQLCLRDQRTGEEGWAFYEKAVDEKKREYPTVVLKRKVSHEAIVKELIGVMLTRADLERAKQEGLLLHVKGQFDTMRVWIQAAYARGFLSLVDEHMKRSS